MTHGRFSTDMPWEMIRVKFATENLSVTKPWEICNRISVGKDPWEISDGKYQSEISDECGHRKFSMDPFRRKLCQKSPFRRTTKIRRLIFSTTIFPTDLCPSEIRRKHPISDGFLVLQTNYCRRKNAFFVVVKLLTIFKICINMLLLLTPNKNYLLNDQSLLETTLVAYTP